MRSLREGLSEISQRGDTVRTLREGTQCQLSGRRFSEIPQRGDSVRTLRGGDPVRTLREGTQ